MLNWIKSLADEAKKENWCVKWACSTCNSRDFRSSLIKRCFSAGKKRYLYNSEKIHSNKPFIMQLLPADIEFCVKTICKELVTLSSEDINQIDSETLRVIFGEIYGKNYIKLIKEILGDSPAGKFLGSMEEHYKKHPKRGAL